MKEALKQLDRTLELDPWFAHARFAIHARFARGYVCLRLERPDEALAEIEAGLEYSGRDPSASPDLGYVLARTGDREQASAIRERLVERSKRAFVDPYSIALMSLRLEHRDETFDRTFDWLDRAFHECSRELIYLRRTPSSTPFGRTIGISGS